MDTPRGVEFGQDARDACLVADIFIVVVEAEVDEVSVAAPLLHYLDGHNIPHVVFINKVDHDPAPMRMSMDRLQAISERPMILRQLPLLEGEAVTGCIDLVSARAYRYADAGPSALIEMPDGDPGGAVREELLETLADYDDVILEHLLEDRQPATARVQRMITEQRG